MDHWFNSTYIADMEDIAITKIYLRQGINIFGEDDVNLVDKYLKQIQNITIMKPRKYT